jgi:arylformamidase
MNTGSAAALKVKGPIVWRDMDQKELDDAYDQEVYAPNRDLVVARRVAASERARAILGPPQRVAYGASEYERLDIFRAPVANAPINIFVHGGGLCAAGRSLRACRCARGHHRLHQCRSGRRRS